MSRGAPLIFIKFLTFVIAFADCHTDLQSVAVQKVIARQGYVRACYTLEHAKEAIEKVQSTSRCIRIYDVGLRLSNLYLTPSNQNWNQLSLRLSGSLKDLNPLTGMTPIEYFPEYYNSQNILEELDALINSTSLTFQWEKSPKNWSSTKSSDWIPFHVILNSTWSRPMADHFATTVYSLLPIIESLSEGLTGISEITENKVLIAAANKMLTNEEWGAKFVFNRLRDAQFDTSQLHINTDYVIPSSLHHELIELVPLFIKKFKTEWLIPILREE